MTDEAKLKKHVQLVEERGKTSTHVSAEINDEGNFSSRARMLGEARASSSVMTTTNTGCLFGARTRTGCCFHCFSTPTAGRQTRSKRSRDG
jgi:hypothetical protein